MVLAGSRKRKRFWIWLGIVAVVVLAVGGIALARLVKGATVDPNRIAKVSRGDVARSVVATGTIQPITKVEVKSKASGIVEKLYVDINNQVNKGQQLAQLDQQEIHGAGRGAAGATGGCRGQRSPPTRPTSSRTR